MSTKGSKCTEQKDASQWVFLVNGEILNHEDDRKLTMCKLKHPRTDVGCMFMFARGDEAVYEVTKFNAPCRSWFIGQTVQHDGGLHITSLIDSTFLALPYLIEAEKGGKYRVLDDLLVDADFPETGRLCHSLNDDCLSHVADLKGCGDTKAYRYNEQRTLDWLKSKVQAVADRLETQDVNVSGGALSHVFIRSTKSANSSPEDYVRYAHGMVSDYLPCAVSQRLRTFLGIKDPEKPKCEKPDIEEPSSKRPRKGTVEATEDYSQFAAAKEVKKGPKTIAQNKLNKVDKTGMKAISSFFSPKGKT